MTQAKSTMLLEDSRNDQTDDQTQLLVGAASKDGEDSCHFKVDERRHHYKSRPVDSMATDDDGLTWSAEAYYGNLAADMAVTLKICRWWGLAGPQWTP